MNDPSAIWRSIFHDHAPPWIIAEIGVNHCGDPQLAHMLVDAARQAGADGVKFQVFTPEEVAADNAPLADYQKDGVTSHNQRSMLASLTLSHQALHSLRQHAEDCGLLFLATPFGLDSLRFLTDLHVAALKIGSGDMLNPLLLTPAAATGLPLILSTGMADLSEVATAVRWLTDAGASNVMLLHCTSCYPADPADANLLAISTMRQAFGLPVGYSDHTDATSTAIVAITLGACLIEKHLTHNRSAAGPDHRASLAPSEFAAFIRQARSAHAALGEPAKRCTRAEADMRYIARRGLIAGCHITKGSVLDEHNVAAVRPVRGIPVEFWPLIKGFSARSDMAPGFSISWSDVDFTQGADVK